MYKYENYKEQLLTKDGQIKLVETVNQINVLPKEFTMQDAFTTGDTWLMIACVDYLCELGFLREVDPNPETWGQDRIFKKNT